MKAHRTDGLSLAFSAVFLAATSIWFLHRVAAVNVPNGGLLLAGTLIVFGVVGLFGSLRSSANLAERTAVIEPATAGSVSGAAGGTASDATTDLPSTDRTP